MPGTMNAVKGQYYSRERHEMVRLLPQKIMRVLEVGCGEGEFAARVRDRLEYWGVEPNTPAARVAEGRLDRVLNGTYEEVRGALPKAYFDLVICNDVIEHMTDHEKFLIMVREVMTPEARLVGSIPNVRFIGNLFEVLIRKDWNYRDYGILDRTHLRFFTQKSIQRALVASGYVIEELRGINSSANFSQGARRWVAFAATRMFQLLTLGFCNDTQYVQFAFRARRAA